MSSGYPDGGYQEVCEDQLPVKTYAKMSLSTSGLSLSVITSLPVLLTGGCGSPIGLT